MKTYVTIFVLFFVISLLPSINSQSQTQSSINIGLDLALPTNFYKSSKLGWGPGLEGVISITPRSSIRVFGAYTRFANKNYPGTAEFAPIRAGYQAFLVPDLIFVFGEAGVILALSEGFEASRSRPSIAFGTGYRQPVGEKTYLQLSAAFNYRSGGKYSGHTWVAFRAAYGLSWHGRKK